MAASSSVQLNRVKCLITVLTLTSVLSADAMDNYATRFNSLGLDVPRYPRYVDSVRRQKTYPLSMPFPCAMPKTPEDTSENDIIERNTTTKPGNKMASRSDVRPTSIHKLRPGDVDVVAGLGDSLVAGNGALEEWALGTFMENRGVSWCTGGDGTWRKFLTLPNILREFNPLLRGYSKGTGEFFMPNAGFNVAFPTASAAEALIQAKRLVARIKRSPKVNFEKDWKVVTILFGANDLCSGQCYEPEGSAPFTYQKNLMVALDYLRDNLPRTYVNLVPAIDVSVSLRVQRSLTCRVLHRLFCTCFHSRGGNEMNTITQMVRDYHKAERELVESGRYDRDDFTVEIQPFMQLFDAPVDPVKRMKKVIDVSFITHDCFHFSQKGHALAANMLWNNMLQPEGTKSDRKLDHILQEFRCPTPQAPYLFTRKNSAIFRATGKQE